MKALLYHQFGGPEVYRIEDVPAPEPGEDEIQVKVDGAGCNPVDWKIREGHFHPDQVRFPAVTLREFSGTVTKLGPGVAGIAVGDGVYGITDRGAAAEFTVASAGAVGPRPKSLDPFVAGLVPLAGMTAWQALFDHGHLEAGQRVLIHAAAGGVGVFAVQLAKWKGAYVIGTASEQNHALLRDLGADELIDYRRQHFEEVVHGVDLVLHAIGPDALPGSLKTLKPGGRLVAISAPPDQEEAHRQGKIAIIFMMQPNPAQLAELARLLDDGTIRTVVDKIVPLEEGPEALAELQKGHTVGKIGLRISG